MSGLIPQDVLSEILESFQPPQHRESLRIRKFKTHLFAPDTNTPRYYFTNDVIGSTVYSESAFFSGTLTLTEDFNDALNLFIDDNLRQVDFFAENTLFLLFSVKPVSAHFLSDRTLLTNTLYAYHFFLVINLTYLWLGFQLSPYTYERDFRQLELEQKQLIFTGLGHFNESHETFMVNLVSRFMDRIAVTATSLTTSLLSTVDVRFQRSEFDIFTESYGFDQGPVRIRTIEKRFLRDVRKMMVNTLSVPVPPEEEPLEAEPFTTESVPVSNALSLTTGDAAALDRYFNSGVIPDEYLFGTQADLIKALHLTLSNAATRLSFLKILSFKNLRREFLVKQSSVTSSIFTLMSNMPREAGQIYDNVLYAIEDAKVRGSVASILLGIATSSFNPYAPYMIGTGVTGLITQNVYDEDFVATGEKRSVLSALYNSAGYLLGAGTSPRSPNESNQEVIAKVTSGFALPILGLVVALALVGGLKREAISSVVGRKRRKIKD